MGNTKKNPRKTKRSRLKQLRKQVESMRNKKEQIQSKSTSEIGNAFDKTTQPSAAGAASQSPGQRHVESPMFLNLDMSYSAIPEKNRSPSHATDTNVDVSSKSTLEIAEDEERNTCIHPARHSTTSRRIMKAKRTKDNEVIESSLNSQSDEHTLPYEVESDDNIINLKEEISGHRIIDVHHFFKELINISGHDSLFNCGLHSMEIQFEKQSGLLSEFDLICKMCRQKFKVKNSDVNLNKSAVAGAMAAGCGYAQLKQFSAAVDVPILTEWRFRASQDEVCDEWEVTAWEVMKKAGELERQAALEEGRVDKNGIPMIDVIVDGSWCKRSYRTNYSALSGTAAIIGRRFGQVLFYAVKNKYCCICARAEKRNETPKQHECYRNFSASSTAMESTIIAEGFKLSIDMHGLIYSRFIADGDSSTYAKIIEARPYASVTVEKIGCKNHILRNFCTKLRLLKTDTKFPKQERQLLTDKKILSGRKYICDAIKYHGSCSNAKPDKIKDLHKDIGNAMFHGYGYHGECNKNICSEKAQTSEVKKMFNTHLFNRIRFIVGNVASQARSLIENVDSNIVETFNGVIAKLIGGKRVNYALKRSYQARCAGAVISFNSGKILTTVHENIHQESPPKKIKKFEEDAEKKREYNRIHKRKRNRKVIVKKNDFDYGNNVNKPDMDSETYELAKASFLKGLEKTEEERREIERRTILQSESGEWLELRRNMLTAFKFGKIVKRRTQHTCVNVVRDMLYKPNIDHVASIKHGKDHEKVALKQLADKKNIKIESCGLHIDEKYPFLGASPDGLAGDTLIEVKCPIAPFKMGIDAAIREKKMHFWKINKRTGKIYVNKNSDWFIQAQGQMHICKKEKCLFAVWYGQNKIKTTIINRDDEFWNKVMEPKLLSFYYDCLLPELVDPRHTRNMPIRDPDYVIKKTAGDTCVVKKKRSKKNTEIKNNNSEDKENKVEDNNKNKENLESSSLEVRDQAQDIRTSVEDEMLLDFYAF